jgi:hypothetical protein
MAEQGGTMWLSVPMAARHFGISERAIRKRIDAGTLIAEREGHGPWRVQVGAAPAVPGAAPGGTGGGTQGGTTTAPIEAAYQVAGEAAPVALVPLETMVAELRGLADQLAELARRNEGLALEVGTLRERQVGHEAQLMARESTLEGYRETIIELRRRAEAAEAEAATLRGRAALPPVAQEPQSATGGAGETHAPPGGAGGGLRARLGRWWRGAGEGGGR